MQVPLTFPQFWEQVVEYLDNSDADEVAFGNTCKYFNKLVKTRPLHRFKTYVKDHYLEISFLITWELSRRLEHRFYIKERSDIFHFFWRCGELILEGEGTTPSKKETELTKKIKQLRSKALEFGYSTKNAITNYESDITVTEPLDFLKANFQLFLEAIKSEDHLFTGCTYSTSHLAYQFSFECRFISKSGAQIRLRKLNRSPEYNKKLVVNLYKFLTCHVNYAEILGLWGLEAPHIIK